MDDANILILGPDEFETIQFIPTPVVVSQPSARGLMITETEYADFDCIGVVRRSFEVGQTFRLSGNAPEGFEDAVWSVIECMAVEIGSRFLAKPDVDELAEMQMSAMRDNMILTHVNLTRFIRPAL